MSPPTIHPDWTVVDSRTECFDQGFVLLDEQQLGKQYMTITHRRVRVRDAETGEIVEFAVPVTRTIVAPANGA